MQHAKVSRADVPGVCHRLDHQRRSRAHLGFRADPADAGRAAFSAWRRDNLYLRNAIDLPEKEILAAHARDKEALLAEVASRTGLVLNPKVLTLGFARRAATYKRATLLFTDPKRLVEIATAGGRIADYLRRQGASRRTSPARR